MKQTIARICILLTAFCLIAAIFYGLGYLADEYSTPRVYEETVVRYSFEYEVDANLVYAVIKAESKFDRRAVSKRGAEGLMQLTKSTAIYVAEKLGENPEGVDLFDAQQNIRYGIWYLSYLNRKFSDVNLAVMAYNAGEGSVRKWLADDLLSGDYEGIPYPETRAYYARVMKFYNLYRQKYYY